MLTDVRFAIRGLLRTPGFSIAAVFTLALGIGVHTAVFSLVDGLMFRPMPYRRAEALVHLHSISSPVRRSYLTGIPRDAVPMWAGQSEVFDGIAIHRISGRMVLEGAGGETINAAAIDPGFMNFLGVMPIIGREFDENDVDTDVAVLSHALWTSLFAADRNVSGRMLVLDGRPFTIIGVMPSGFYFPLSNPAHVWLPLSARPDSVSAVARLRTGMTVEVAQRRADVLSARFQKDMPRNDQWLVLLRGFEEERMPARGRFALALLVCAVGLVVLVACANVAALFIGRTFDRMREMGVRAALGASRARLLRHIAFETLVVAALGGCLGLLLNGWLIDVSRFILPAQVTTAELNSRVVVFALSLMLFASFVCAIFPAWHVVRRDFYVVLGSSNRTAGYRPSQRRAYRALVAAELAITFVMLLGTGLLANSFVRLTAVDVGFETNNLALVTVRLQKDRYPTVALENQFYKEALRRARLMPGITEVSAGGAVPPRAGIRFNISEQSDAQGSPISAVTTSVEPNYFQTLRIPMLSGRPFNDRDTPHGDRVAIVNEEIARELWPDRDPIGQRLRVGSHLALVVGVVSDVKGYQFRSGSDRFKAYLPLTQEPPRGSWVLVARTSSDPNGVVRQLRQLVNDIDPNAMIREATTAEASYDTMLTVPRLIFQFMAVFSGGALLLALIGIYGLVASDVAQRRQEIGIRMALGADSAQIGRLAVRDAIRPAAIGLSLGAAGGLAGSMLLRGFLYELSPHDPVTLFCVGAVQLATVAIVAWLPARRASRLDPIATLRTD